MDTAYDHEILDTLNLRRDWSLIPAGVVPAQAHPHAWLSASQSTFNIAKCHNNNIIIMLRVNVEECMEAKKKKEKERESDWVWIVCVD